MFNKKPLLLSYEKYGGIMYEPLNSDMVIFAQGRPNNSCIELLFSEAFIASVVMNEPFIGSKTSLLNKLSIIDGINNNHLYDDKVVSHLMEEVSCFYKTVGAWLHRMLLYALRRVTLDNNITSWTIEEIIGLPLAVTTDVPSGILQNSLVFDITSVSISDYNVTDLFDTIHSASLVAAMRDMSIKMSKVGEMLALESLLGTVPVGKKVERFCFQ